MTPAKLTMFRLHDRGARALGCRHLRQTFGDRLLPCAHPACPDGVPGEAMQDHDRFAGWVLWRRDTEQRGWVWARADLPAEIPPPEQDGDVTVYPEVKR